MPIKRDRNVIRVDFTLCKPSEKSNKPDSKHPKAVAKVLRKFEFFFFFSNKFTKKHQN